MNKSLKTLTNLIVAFEEEAIVSGGCAIFHGRFFHNTILDCTLEACSDNRSKHESLVINADWLVTKQGLEVRFHVISLCTLKSINNSRKYINTFYPQNG